MNNKICCHYIVIINLIEFLYLLLLIIIIIMIMIIVITRLWLKF